MDARAEAGHTGLAAATAGRLPEPSSEWIGGTLGSIQPLGANSDYCAGDGPRPRTSAPWRVAARRPVGSVEVALANGSIRGSGRPVQQRENRTRTGVRPAPASLFSRS